jgi:formate C-acetyltransferase
MDKIDDMDKIYFYEAVIQTCEGILIYADRLSAYALELAEKEQDPKRKAELKKIAEVNTRVPANPPQTFQEALQALWTTQSLFLLEENQCSTSLGRFDQYVFPLFEEDIRTGVLDENQAFELMGCFILSLFRRICG